MTFRRSVGAFVFILAFGATQQAGAQTAITLAPSTLPASGEPGVTNISVTGSNFPTGTIMAASVMVSLQPSSGGKAVTTVATSVTTVAGTTRRVSFTIPASVSVTTPTTYSVSISGTTASNVAFATPNTAVLSVNPVATLISINPNSGQAGQSLTVAVTGSFSNFLQGSTVANFGAGITVTSATITSATTASVQISIGNSAAAEIRSVTMTTGIEVASLAGGFAVTANQAPTITSTPPTGPVWENLAATGGPPPGRDMGSSPNVYDDGNDRLIFFSGDWLPEPPQPDVWVLANASGSKGIPTWIQLQPMGPGPGGREEASLTYVKASNRLIICGGTNGPNDCWVLTNANGLGGSPSWISLPSMPDITGYGSAGYDPSTNHLIMLGPTSSTTSEVLILSNADGTGTPTWSRPTVLGQQPASRYNHSVVYDPTSNELIVFGGLNRPLPQTPNNLNDLWVLTNANGNGGPSTWIPLSPEGPLPPGRNGAGFVYDPTTNQALMFGGAKLTVFDSEGADARNDAYADLWMLTNANGIRTPQWTQLNPIGRRPIGHFLSAMGRNPSNGGVSMALGRWEQSAIYGSEILFTDNWRLTPAATGAVVGENFSYQVSASDPDGDALTYTLAQAPSGMNIGVTTGLLSYVPTANQIGIQVVSIRVDDGKGLSATQTLSIVVVPNADTISPTLVSVSPNFGQAGTIVPVTITSQNTNLVPGQTSIEFEMGTSLPHPYSSSVTVMSATTALVQVVIPANTPTGSWNVNFGDGFEIMTAGIFSVEAAPVVEVSAVSPTSGVQGQKQLSVNITGLGTHFAQTTSIAAFGAGVTVKSLTVTSPTTATALLDIDSSALVGPRTVAVQTGSEQAMLANGFTVQTGVINVSAGSTQIVALPAVLNLKGSANGPLGDRLTTTWSQVNGPTQSTITNPASLITQVSFPVFTGAGTYTFRLTATDGVLSNTSDVQITVTLCVSGKEQGTRMGGTVGVPVPLPDGRFRMNGTRFPGAPNNPLLSFISTDSLNWAEESGVRLQPPSDPGIIVQNSDGSQRLYYYWHNGDYIWRIYSARSSDGSNWTQDSGVRIDAGGPLGCEWVEWPSIVKLLDGSLRMYYSCGLSPAGNAEIVSATSTDGLNWTNESGIRIAGPNASSPTVESLPNGGLRMYYLLTTFTDNSASNTGWMVSARSQDGLAWTNETGIRLNHGGAGAPDERAAIMSALLPLPDGTYRLFYTGFDGSGNGGNFDYASTQSYHACVLGAASPPTLIAGGPQTITLPISSVTLSGVESDDQPAGTQVLYSWTVIGGPGTVSFSSSNALATAAQFTQPGQYQLRLTAFDSKLYGYDDVYVTVLSATSPAVLNVSPQHLAVAQTVTVNLSAQATHFTQGQTEVDFGPGVSVTSLSITNANQAVAQLTIDSTAILGSHSAIVTTGTEIVSLPNALILEASNALPTLTSVSPNSGQQGQGGTIAIVGQNTHFIQGSTQVSFGADITVSNIVISCPTCLTAQLQIPTSAAIGPVTVMVTTGSEVVSLPVGFTIVPGTSLLTSMIPATGQQGQTVTSTITGQYTHWTQGTTQVSLGAGIAVTSLTVTSATSLSVQLAIDPVASVGTRALTVTTGSEIVTAASVFTVQAASPTLYSLSPGGGTQGQQNLSVAITGLATHFTQGTSVASFGAGVTVMSLTVASAISATAVVNIDPAAAAGARTVTVTTGSEVATFTNGFIILTSGPIIYTLDPGGSSQGAMSLPVQITGLNTHFVQGASVATFGAGIVITSLVVTNATTATATINIDPAATIGPRTATVTTGGEVASFVNGFSVIAGVRGITQISPSAGPQGLTNVTVAITAAFTHFAQGTTTVSFGAGITVNTVTVTDATDLSVSISISAAAATGSRIVTVTTGSEVVTAQGGFTVTASTPTLVSVNPSSATQGQQNLSLTITGQFTNFIQGTSTPSFSGAGITINSVTVTSSTSLTANITVANDASTGAHTVTVTTGAEMASLPNVFTVQSATNQLPAITISSTWSVMLPSSLTLAYTVSDPGLTQGGTLNEVWSTVSGPGTVGFLNQTPTSIVANFSQAGTYVLQLSAMDTVTQLTTNQNVTVTVTGTLPPPPNVSITSPTEGTSITTLTNIIGNVSSSALASWTLEYQPPNSSLYQTIATGTTPVSNGSLGIFDPTLLLNGNALIRLRAIDTAGQTAIAGPVTLVVMGNQKLGNFTVSFNDLSVPVAGLPIQVVRTYDSRDKTAGDFGVGWRLDVSAVTLQTNRVLGDKWTESSSGGAFPTYSIQGLQPHQATVTFVDGTTYQFQAVLNPSSQQLVPIEDQQMTVTFAPMGITPPNASLAILGNNQPAVSGSVPGPVELLDFDTLQSFNPDLYQLTMPDGRVLVISQSSGLQSMTDANGNKLTITAAGIMHSSGKSVAFLRDSSSRITKITDPNGNAINYGYDPSNDLTSVQDAVGNTSTFTYDANHGLLTIVDPAGLQPIKNVYDSNGRLIQHIDAYGNTINYGFNPSAQQESVTDRLGNLTVNYYDANGNIVQVTDALGGNTYRTYDASNNLLTETNPLNEKRTYTYDANNNRLTETDPLGNTTTYTYNNRNQVLTITDALGRVTANTYDGNGNQLTTKDATGNTTGYAYNAQGLRTSMTDPLGNVTSYQYDGPGNLIQQTDPLGHATSYTYDANGNKLSQTQTRTTTSGVQTMVTGYQYDADNRLTKTTYADGSTTQIAYNAIGKQSVTTDQLSRQTNYTYDLMGRLTQTMYPDQTTESSTYDAEGDRITSTDRGGRTTNYAYDPLKRLYQTTSVDQTKTSTTYDAASEVTGVTDARGNVTQYRYDAAGHRTAVIDALAHQTGFTYDAVGNQSSMTDANGHTTQYQYDADNRRTQVIYPDATADTTSYDAVGRTTAKKDEAGHITQYGYDAVGRLINVTDTLSQVTQYTYDEVGNHLTQSDANGHTTTFAYDNLGRRTSRSLPLGMAETSRYDTAGNLQAKIEFNGKTTTYTYDASNRLLSKAPDGSLGQIAVRFTYSATGQRLSMADASGITTYIYDQRDRLLQKVTPVGTLTYTYDAAGNLLTMRSSNTGGTSVNYSYDPLNRVATVTDNRLAAGVTTYVYDNAGNLKSYSYPNGVQSTYTYNALNRLTNLAVENTGTLASYTYTLGPAGNRTAVTELSGRQETYAYDSLYRLTGETISGGSVNGAIGYTYDHVGNRLNRASTVAPVTASTSSYDANDRLASDAYDANGNTTASGGNTYAYDFENRLTSENGTAITMIYDGDGNRVKQIAGGTTTSYLVDDRNLTGYAQVLEEITAGAVQRVYTYGLNRISQSQTSGTSFYGYDGHGNVRLLTDTTGAVTDRYDYDAFGNVISQTGATPNVYLYSGEQNDPSLGLYYLRARYLNANSGRFFSFDPLSMMEDSIDLDDSPLPLHKYAYADADPVDKTDPGGLFAGIAEIALTTSIINTLPLPQRIPTTNLFHRTEAASIELSTAGAEVSYRELQGRLAAGPPPYFKRPELGASQIRVDPDGVSTFEYPHLPDPTDRQYAVGFFFRVTPPKETNRGPYDVISLPGCEATYTPDPPNTPGHWSINCATDTKGTIAAYVKRNYLLGLRFPPFFITLPGWHGIPQERRFGDPGQ